MLCERPCRRRLQAEGRMTHAGASAQWLAEDEEGRGVLPRRRKVVPREDRVILRAWFRQGLLSLPDLNSHPVL